VVGRLQLGDVEEVALAQGQAERVVVAGDDLPGPLTDPLAQAVEGLTQVVAGGVAVLFRPQQLAELLAGERLVQVAGQVREERPHLLRLETPPGALRATFDAKTTQESDFQAHGGSLTCS